VSFNLEQTDVVERRHGSLSLVLIPQAGGAADLVRDNEMIGVAHVHEGPNDEGKATDGARQGADPLKWNWTVQK
jgi:hypothetical protein